MDGRARVRNAIRRAPIDRIPRFDSFWEDTLSAWHAQGLPEGVKVEEYFDFDIVEMFIDASMRREQKLLRKDDEFMTVQDRHGYTIRQMIGKSRVPEFSDHVTVDRSAWNALKPSFALDPQDRARIDDVSYYLHMDPYPTWQEARAKYDRLRKTGKYVAFVVYGPWEANWRHRGYTDLMMDIATDPDWVREMAETHMGLALATVQHCLTLGMTPDGLFLVDDLGSTRALLVSPQSWRAIFKPAWQTLGRFLREHDVDFLLHSCGNVRLLIDDFIECGLNVLQPLQAAAGLDVRQLKGIYGEKLTFWGNIDVRKMSGPAEDLEVELREKITAAKVGGGYMYHSDHSVPPEVTFDRYQWIMGRVGEYGRY